MFVGRSVGPGTGGWSVRAGSARQERRAGSAGDQSGWEKSTHKLYEPHIVADECLVLGGATQEGQMTSEGSSKGEHEGEKEPSRPPLSLFYEGLGRAHDDSQVYLSVAEASRLLGLPVEEVEELVRTGQVDSTSSSVGVLLQLKSVLTYLKLRERLGRPEDPKEGGR